MSKLIEKLREVSQRAPQSMGFRVSAGSVRQKMLLVARLSPDEVSLIAEEADHQVDALLFSVTGLGEDTLPQLAEAMKDLPYGLELGGESKAEILQLKKLGCDFVLFDPALTPASLLEIEAIGKVAIIPPQWDDSLLRGMGKSTVDAVLLHLEGEVIPTVYQVILCQRVASLVQRPLLVNVSGELACGSIQALREAGVNGLVLGTEGQNLAETVSHLSQNIAALPTEVKSPLGIRREVTLPAVTPEGSEF